MVVADIHHDITNTQTVISDIQQGVVNTYAIVSGLHHHVSGIHHTMLKNQEWTGSRNQSVSVVHAFFIAESILTTT